MCRYVSRAAGGPLALRVFWSAFVRLQPAPQKGQVTGWGVIDEQYSYHLPSGLAHKYVYRGLSFWICLFDYSLLLLSGTLFLIPSRKSIIGKTTYKAWEHTTAEQYKCPVVLAPYLRSFVSTSYNAVFKVIASELLVGAPYYCGASEEGKYM